MKILDFLATKIQSGEIKTYSMVEILSHAFNISKTEAKRNLQSNAVEINGYKHTNLSACLFKGDVIKLGKHRFIRIADGFDEGFNFKVS